MHEFAPPPAGNAAWAHHSVPCQRPASAPCVSSRSKGAHRRYAATRHSLLYGRRLDKETTIKGSLKVQTDDDEEDGEEG